MADILPFRLPQPEHKPQHNHPAPTAPIAEQLCIGRRVYYPGDMANPDGYGVVVAHRRHDQVDVVLFDGREWLGIWHSRFQGLRPWRVCDKVHGPGMVDACMQRAAAVKAQRITDEAMAKVKHAEAVAALVKANPHLVQGGKPGANLRAALKAAGLKASVRTGGGRTCSALDVRCTKEAYDAVNAIAQRFQYGSFDGMTDCYNYDRFNAWCDAFGGVQYVSTYVEHD